MREIFSKENIEEKRLKKIVRKIRKHFQKKSVFQKSFAGNVKKLETMPCKSKVQEFQLENYLKIRNPTIKPLNINDDLKD